MSYSLRSSLCVLYLVIVSSVSQQATESDGIGDAPQVDEEHSGDGLNVETLVEITRQPRQFPLYVQVQAPTKAIVHVQHIAVRMLHMLHLSAWHINLALKQKREEKFSPPFPISEWGTLNNDIKWHLDTHVSRQVQDETSVLGVDFHKIIPHCQNLHFENRFFFHSWTCTN